MSTGVGEIDWADPVNRDSPLADKLAAFWLALPGWDSGPRLPNVRSLGDNTPSASHGTLTNGPTWTAGENGFGALRQTGTEYTTAPALNLSAGFTASMWLNRGGASVYISFCQTNLSQYTFYLRIGGNCGLTIGGSFKEVTGPNPAVGAWAHVALTFDGSTLSSYLNGGLVASASHSGNPDASAGGGIGIGSQWTNSGERFVGDVGGATIHAHALPQSGVAALYDEFRRGFPDLLRRVPERAWSFGATAGGGASGAGSSAGAATVSGVGASTAAAAGSSAGVATVAGVGASSAAAAGAASGVAAASGVGASDAEAVASSSGVATAAGVGASTAAAVGSSAGVATASGVGASTVDAVASSTGTASTSWVGASTATGVGSSAGVAAVAGVGSSASTGQGAGAAAGVAAVSAVGSSTADAVASSAGVATVSGVGSSAADGQGAGSSAGTSTAAAVGSSQATAVYTAAGFAAATGTGTSTAVAVWAAAGAAAVVGYSPTSADAVTFVSFDF